MPLDILNFKNYGPENKRRYKYVLVVIDNFSKFGWTITLKNKNALTIKDSFENILKNSERMNSKQLLEPDVCEEFVNKIFPDLLNKDNNKR